MQNNKSAGRGVLLRDVSQADLPIFFAQQLDPEATRMADFPSREHDVFMAHWAKIMADPKVMLRTIISGGQVAGNVVSFVPKGGHGREGEREVGYWLGKTFWGRGIASAALAAFLEIEKTRPLFGYVATGNLGSIRVLEKCGFMRQPYEGGVKLE